jgi:epoxide hydrolase-like predicted phosphatase
VAEAARRGLLVDFGGVLTTDVFASFAAFCADVGLDPQELAQRFRHDPETRDLLIGLEEGTLAPADFEAGLAPLLGVEPEGLIERLMARAERDEAMIAAVRAARAAGLRTGLISNSWGVERYDSELLAELFDGVVLSGDVGVRKPSRRMYELGAEAVGLAPEECVFVDDLGFNLKPAAELGMATIKHERAPETIAALERALGVELR